MWLEDHFGSGSTLQRNERVKLAASFWNRENDARNECGKAEIQQHFMKQFAVAGRPHPDAK